MSLRDTAQKMKLLSPQLGALPTDLKNKALLTMAKVLRDNYDQIVNANNLDLASAEHEKLGAPVIARLKFQGEKFEHTCQGLEATARLSDPVGRILSARELDDDLKLFQVSCPIGVVGMIFESRPDALVQIASLCLKSGNAIILKGGSEAKNTNKVLTDLLIKAGKEAGIPDGWIFLLQSRDEVKAMLELEESIDLIIPRGSNEFVQYIMKNTNIPVMGHADGICHLYIDRQADLEMAVRLAVDSKTQYVAVCNAVETILVHEDIAQFVLPPLKLALEKKNVLVKGCPKTKAILPSIESAYEEDWLTEYLDYIVSIKVVKDFNEAVWHINHYGSHHTDAIVTSDKLTAENFMNLVDSANVFQNASTRFADGFKYGLGAEVGISTSKIHARGPVGLEGMVIYKWKLYGKGHLAATYSGPEAKGFTHRDIPL